MVWLILFLDSLRADLRLEGRHRLADAIRDRLRENFDYRPGDLPLRKLREYRDGYRQYRNMPNASIVELEMF